jgi:DNA-binding CsgD family transcriptional regulator
MPRPSVPSLTLDLRDARVRALLAEPTHLSVWEVLRRFDRPVPVREIAQVIRCEESIAQAVVDALVALRLVVSHAASASSRLIRYEAASKALVIAFDPDEPDQLSELGRIGERFKELGRAGRVSLVEYPGSDAFAFEYARPAHLDEEQLARLKSLLRQVRNLLEQSASTRSVAVGDGGVLCTHQVLIEVHPCRPGTLPLPQIVLAPRAEVGAACSLVSGTGMPDLSLRERTVALALAAGRSRPAIAGELGLSVHTVATVSKRVYAKLKVRSRAELANRLRG